MNSPLGECRMQHFNAFLKHDQKLAQLSEKAQSLTALRKLWDTVTPEALKQYTHACDIEHKRLTVLASNAAVAAKIKLLLPSLLTKLQKHGLEVTSIRVRVQVQSNTKKPMKIPRKLDTHAACQLENLANQIDNNPELTSILKKLARRSEES